MGKGHLERPRRGWEEIGMDLTSNSFKTCLEGIGLVDVDGVRVAEDLLQWRFLVYLFICGLFDETANNSDHIALNHVTISE
jgi:hypothetical protein